jgi:hypothetical protein
LLRDQLEIHLAMLKNQGLIESWHDRRINVGDEFSGSISAELNKADVILLLVSPDFLASKYCYDIEMQRAMERHEAHEARVIPVILRHCDWHHAPFGKLVAAPKDGKSVKAWADIDAAFLDVVGRIRAVLPAKDLGISRPITSQSASAPAKGPRSSNLRIKNEFSDIDKDRFLQAAFDYVSEFFKNSLSELESRHDGLKTTYRQIDAGRFSCVIYRHGKAISRCKIMQGGLFGSGIGFSYNDEPIDGSINEYISMEHDDHNIYLKAMTMGGQRNSRLTPERASEHLWSLLIEPLQR